VLRTAGLAAAAAAVVAGGAVVVVSALDDGNGPTVAATSPAPAPTTAPARPMQRVDEDVTGALSLTPVAWGTRLDLTCTYAASYARALDETFALFVRTADGQVEKVATWRGVIGREMRLTAATATDATDISSVVVRTTDGEPVLRLTE
jgi:succinate dehydrogenase/fumarate reductase flavoprotein subunit